MIETYKSDMRCISKTAHELQDSRMKDLHDLDSFAGSVTESHKFEIRATRLRMSCKPGRRSVFHDLESFTRMVEETHTLGM